MLLRKCYELNELINGENKSQEVMDQIQKLRKEIHNIITYGKTDVPPQIARVVLRDEKTR